MTRSRRNLFIGLAVAAFVIVCCLAVCLLSTLLVSFQRPRAPSFTAAVTRPAAVVPEPTESLRASTTPARSTPTARPTRTPSPTPGAQSLDRDDVERDIVERLSTEEQLRNVVLPTRDMRDLAMRLRPGVGDIPRVVNPTPPSYEQGDIEEFWVGNVDTEEHQRIEAELRVKLPHVYMWVERGVDVDQDDLRRSAERFEERTFPTGREFFGSEWSPGVDNDVHLTILNATNLGDNVAGYFSSADEFSSLANPYSNEKEMFYVNLDNNPPGTFFYDGTLAHEFQHMIHWANDRNEDTWVNEGMSELATELNGYSRGGADIVFSEEPDTQLNTWTDEPSLNTAHYGSAYLFMSYFLDRFGEELTKAVVASPLDGPAGFDEALSNRGFAITFDDVFADWLIANYLDSLTLEGGRYGYRRDNPRTAALEASYRRYPVSETSTVHQYAADYYALLGPGAATVAFCGDTQSQLVATDAHSGDFAWWSHRADDTDVRLTRAFDLTSVSEATLEFWTWFDIEEGYDYGYVEVSLDNGASWEVLQGRHARDYDPVGNAFGVGYTGTSGGEDSPAWIEEQVDLTPYTGSRVLLRFEYVTDDAVNYPGWLVDSIAIPELAYSDDGEAGEQGWRSEGWVLNDNQLTQHWMVQVIEQGLIETEVRQMTVGDDGCGRLSLENAGFLGRRAVLIISALAPVTTEQATYSFQIEPRVS